MGFVLIFLVVFLLAHIIQSKYRLLKCGSRIPGPWFIPFVGNIQFMSQIKPEAVFASVEQLRQTYRSTFRIWLGTQLWVFLDGAEETRQALNESSLVKADTFQLLSSLIGNGLLISEGEHWHSHRRALGPAFHPNVLASFTGRIQHHAGLFVDRVLAKGEVEIADYLFPCMLDTICETSMGKNLHTQQDECSPYVRAFHETSHLLFKRMINPILFSDFIYQHTAAFKKLTKSVDVIHGLTDQVIREQLDTIEREKNGKYNRSLLNILLTAEINGQRLSFKDVKDEVNTFLFAGVDTTTAALNFVLFCLAKYPECQERLYSEIVDNSNDLSNINEFQYLDMFIKECLRLYTIVPLTGRQVTKDIKIGKYHLCPGTTVWINMYGLAHDNRYFPEPERFNPERFDANATPIPSFAFIPYSGGPHSCIGRKYAMLIMKILTVVTLRKARVQLKHPDEQLILVAEMVLKSRNGIKLIFDQRHPVSDT